MNKKTVGTLYLAIVISMLAFSYATFAVRAFLPADLNQDGEVNMKDVNIAIAAFNSSPGSPRWNSSADLDNNTRIDMRDILMICLSFGKH